LGAIGKISSAQGKTPVLYTLHYPCALLDVESVTLRLLYFAHREIADVEKVGFGTSPQHESTYLIDFTNGNILQNHYFRQSRVHGGYMVLDCYAQRFITGSGGGVATVSVKKVFIPAITHN